MENYHVVLTSLNTISYIYVMDYVRNELNFKEDQKQFVQEMLLNDLSHENLIRLVIGDSKYCSTLPDAVKIINGILHSYFINKLFPYVSKEAGIYLDYKPIVNPYEIRRSYFSRETVGSIPMAFQVCFETRDTYNRFKLKYPVEREKLNFFNQTTYRCI